MTRLDRLALGVKYQDALERRALARRLGRPSLPRQRLVHPLRDHPEPGKGSPAPGDVPTRLPEYCLRLHGLSRARTVADPFLGLGATTAACARLGVDAIGIEIDEHYLKEAIARTRAAAAARERRRTSAAPRRVTTA